MDGTTYVQSRWSMVQSLIERNDVDLSFWTCSRCSRPIKAMICRCRPMDMTDTGPYLGFMNDGPYPAFLCSPFETFMPCMLVCSYYRHSVRCKCKTLDLVSCILYLVTVSRTNENFHLIVIVIREWERRKEKEKEKERKKKRKERGKGEKGKSKTERDQG